MVTGFCIKKMEGGGSLGLSRRKGGGGSEMAKRQLCTKVHSLNIGVALGDTTPVRATVDPPQTYSSDRDKTALDSSTTSS